MPQPIDFQGRTVLVTGGARGIGLHLTRQLIVRGANVLVVGRDQQALDEIEALRPGRIFTLAADLGESGMPQAVARWVADQYPDCSMLINNAAIMNHDDLTAAREVSLSRIDEEIRINMIAPLQLAVAMLPVLSAHRRAVVVNVTSGLAVAPKPGAAVYCATKAGLRHFTRAFRDQCDRAGLSIQVTEVVMTLVETGLSQAATARRYPPDRAAHDLLEGVQRGLPEVWIEKTRLLRVVHRVAPELAYRIMRSR